MVKRLTAEDKRAFTTVRERADGRCEGCGVAAPLELHHRRFRSRGGKHTVPNLVALCGSGNHTGCHGLAHSASPPPGWAISRYESRDELWVPFVARDGVGYWLTGDGRRERLEDANT